MSDSNKYKVFKILEDLYKNENISKMIVKIKNFKDI